MPCRFPAGQWVQAGLRDDGGRGVVLPGPEHAADAADHDTGCGGSGEPRRGWTTQRDDGCDRRADVGDLGRPGWVGRRRGHVGRTACIARIPRTRTRIRPGERQLTGDPVPDLRARCDEGVRAGDGTAHPDGLRQGQQVLRTALAGTDVGEVGVGGRLAERHESQHVEVNVVHCPPPIGLVGA